MSSGRVQTLAVATRPGGQVVYERFYDSFSEAEKGEVRACCCLRCCCCRSAGLAGFSCC